MSSYRAFRFRLVGQAILTAALCLPALAYADVFTTAPSTPVIGSQNTVTADPAVRRPHTTPCQVQLFANLTFADFSPKSFTYAPPAGCPGPWARVVLEADFAINAGRQFDRTANIWLGGTNIYFGTTAEPSHTVARNWHVESDLTDYAALFAAPQAGEVDLGNLVNSTYTSVLTGSADLLFYPRPGGDDSAAGESAAHAVADQVLALSAGATGGTVSVSGSGQLTRTFSLPHNIERAVLDVYAQSQASEEFWYTCVPTADAGELQSCPGTAFRETEITIDGQAAGVAPVYPWIYTGGIDPGLWRPIPGVQTLNFKPYRVDLTPFAGMLSDGLPHTVALGVFNAQDHFSVTATLLLYLDHGSTQVTGSVLEDTLSTTPQVSIQPSLTTAADGTVSGTLGTTSARKFSIAGEVFTSHGRVRTEVEQRIEFSNRQQFISSPASGNLVQNITQDTRIGSLTRTSGDGDSEAVQDARHFDWPLTADISFVVNADGSATQTTTIDQAYREERQVSGAHHRESFRVVSDEVTPASTLLISPTGVLTETGQSSSQRFFSLSSAGECYSREITATGGALSGVTDGRLCSEHD